MYLREILKCISFTWVQIYSEWELYGLQMPKLFFMSKFKNCRELRAEYCGKSKKLFTFEWVFNLSLLEHWEPTIELLSFFKKIRIEEPSLD